jgi:hypothetical protein
MSWHVIYYLFCVLRLNVQLVRDSSSSIPKLYTLGAVEHWSCFSAGYEKTIWCGYTMH